MLSKKEIYTLAGEVSAACTIMAEVRVALYQDPVTDDETVRAVEEARYACEKLRKALRKVSYEVENVREDS